MNPIHMNQAIHKFCVYFLCSFLLWGCAAIKTSKTAVEMHGDLRLEGNQIIDQHGDAVSFAGVSLFWGNAGWADGAGYGPDEYYNENVVAYVQREWNAPIIRIAMGAETGGGYIQDPEGRMDKINTVAQAAMKHGMYFIVDWHSHHAEDNPDDAVAFFEKIARRYGETPNIIYEIYNEPLNTADWSTVVKPYAEKVIAAIRAIDPDNIITVGTQTWSQDVDKAADDPVVGFDNIAYTLHFYAGSHKQDLRDKAIYAMDKGLTLMVTEWGTVNSNGDGGPDVEETLRWMEFMREHQMTHCNWSLHSKAEGASILVGDAKPDATWAEGNFSESGKLVRSIVQGWHHYHYAGAK